MVVVQDTRDLSVHGLNGVGKSSWVDMAEMVYAQGGSLARALKVQVLLSTQRAMALKLFDQKDKLRCDPSLSFYYMYGLHIA